MRSTRAALTLTAFAVAFSAIAVSAATPRTPEIRIPTSLTSNTSAPFTRQGVAISKVGDLVAAGGRVFGGRETTFFRTFTPEGDPAGPLTNLGRGSHVDVAFRPTGEDFVVVWSELYTPSGLRRLFARRYGADGTPSGSVIPVSEANDNNQTRPRVAVGGDGRFVVAWFGAGAQDTLARVFDSADSAVTGEFVVNTFRDGPQFSPDVGMAQDGSFVIAWDSPQDGSGTGIYAQRFSPSVTRRGAEFRVNTTTPGDQRDVSIGVNGSGRFVVGWSSDVGADGSFGRIYKSNGAPATGEISLFPDTGGGAVAVDLDDTGRVVAVQVTTGDGDIQGRLYRPTGRPLGEDFIANARTTGVQTWPAVAMAGEGSFAAAWWSLPGTKWEYSLRAFDP
jgi:hypothetical protein